MPVQVTCLCFKAQAYLCPGFTSLYPSDCAVSPVSWSQYALNNLLCHGRCSQLNDLMPYGRLQEFNYKLFSGTERRNKWVCAMNLYGKIHIQNVCFPPSPSTVFHWLKLPGTHLWPGPADMERTDLACWEVQTCSATHTVLAAPERSHLGVPQHGD